MDAVCSQGNANARRRTLTELKHIMDARRDQLKSPDCSSRRLGQAPSGGDPDVLVGELSVLIKRRHPEVQAEIDRVYREHLAKLGKRRRDPATQDD